MSKHLLRDLESLEKRLLVLAGQVEEAVRLCPRQAIKIEAA